MFETEHAAILGSGVSLPKRIMTNDEMERALGLEPGFILEHTGIQERRWTDDDNTLASMAAEAALDAVKEAAVSRITRILIARDTILTRRAFPIELPVIEKLMAAGIQTRGAASAGDFDNFCPGICHAINYAWLMVACGQAENVLIVAPTDYSDMVDLDPAFNRNNDVFGPSKMIRQFSIPSTKHLQPPKMNAFLWGCGAGALVIGKSDQDGILAYGIEGTQRFHHAAYGIGETTNNKGFTALDGRAISMFALAEVPGILDRFLNEHNLTAADIDIMVPHQPNPRLLARVAQRLNWPEDKMVVICDKLGNLIGASIPVAYHLAKKEGRIRKGHTVLFCAFGDKLLTAAVVLLRES